MTNLQEITLSLVAAKNARDDARAHWKEVAEIGGQTNVDAAEKARVAQMNLEHYSRLFRELLVALRQEELLMLSIDALDRESLVSFRSMVSRLELDEYTQPIVYSSFDHMATTWRMARRFLKSARELESIATSIGPAELVQELEQLRKDEPDQPYADVLKGWQHLVSLSGQTGETTGDDLDASREAASKLVRYARAQLENVTAALSAKINGMRAQELRGAIVNLDADLGLELKRALESGLVPCRRHVLVVPQFEPKPEPQSRTAVDTLTRPQEAAEDAQLSPEQEAMVEKLLRGVDDHTNN